MSKALTQVKGLTLSCPIGTFVDFTLSNARRVYLSMGNPLGRKGLRVFGKDLLNGRKHALQEISNLRCQSCSCSCLSLISLLLNCHNELCTNKEHKMEKSTYIHQIIFTKYWDFKVINVTNLSLQSDIWQMSVFKEPFYATQEQQ